MFYVVRIQIKTVSVTGVVVMNRRLVDTLARFNVATRQV